MVIMKDFDRALADRLRRDTEKKGKKEKRMAKEGATNTGTQGAPKITETRVTI